MKKLFIDTNIVIDLLGKREPFHEDAAKIFSLADRGKIKWPPILYGFGERNGNNNHQKLKGFQKFKNSGIDARTVSKK